MSNNLIRDCIEMREEARVEYAKALNLLNIAENNCEIDKAVFKIDLAERKLNYAVKLSGYIQGLPEHECYDEKSPLFKALRKYFVQFGGEA